MHDQGKLSVFFARDPTGIIRKGVLLNNNLLHSIFGDIIPMPSLKSILIYQCQPCKTDKACEGNHPH